MSGIHRLRITTGPSEQAATVADLATDLVAAQANGFDLGDPEASFDALGEPIEASRTITIPLQIKGEQKTVGQAMSAIARAVSVPDRWLLVQRTPSTDPVWFRLHPQSPGSLDIGNAYVSGGGWWAWTLALTVDSTSVGERRTIPRRGATSATTTVTNDGYARGIVIDAPGDATMPLRIDVTPGVSYPGRTIGVSTFSVPWDSPLIAGAEPAIIREDTDFATVSGVSTRTTGSGYLSGGTGITVSMSSTATRLMMAGHANSWKPEPGRYLILARLYRDGSTGTAQLRLGQRWFGQDAWQAWRTWRPTDGGNRSSWLPIGYLQHPFGDTGQGLTPQDVAPSEIAVQVRGDGSSSTLHLDQVAYFPVDLARGTSERFMRAAFDANVGASSTLSWRVDGEHGRISIADGFGQVHSTPQPLRAGGWPAATPGMATAITWFIDTSDTPLGFEGVSGSFSMRVSGAPRLLHLGRE